MATWVLGDVHGCASEFATLLDVLQLGPRDQLVSVGDLLHRGPDPLGVARLFREARGRWILGNHERVALARHGAAPERPDGTDRPIVREPRLDDARDLAGDGDRPLEVNVADLPELFAFLGTHDGYFLEHEQIDGAGPTPDGRAWTLVHAGLPPATAPAEATAFDLTRLRRLEGRDRSFWYEHYAGPTLILFGHTPFREPRRVIDAGRLVALGLDTGCVFGGSLTAYCPETDDLVGVPAERVWAAR